MSKRAEAKKATRHHILEAARAAFVDQGLLTLSTADVARSAGVAHGTIFFHFESKEKLLLEMLQRELAEITEQLYEQLHLSDTLEDLLNTYLDALEAREPFFAVLARETPFYAPELRRSVMGYEAAVRSYFYSALSHEILAARCRDVDVTTALGFLFGSLNYLLSLKDAYTEDGSVIAEQRAAVTQTFLALVAL